MEENKEETKTRDAEVWKLDKGGRNRWRDLEERGEMEDRGGGEIERKKVLEREKMRN